MSSLTDPASLVDNPFADPIDGGIISPELNPPQAKTQAQTKLPPLIRNKTNDIGGPSVENATHVKEIAPRINSAKCKCGSGTGRNLVVCMDGTANQYGEKVCDRTLCSLVLIFLA
jgi:hypothetical protein